MDIRQIQALHAQYSPQPVVIDIAGHTAAMPALTGPESGTGRGWRIGGLSKTVRKASRPALICLAIASIAAGGGMSAARIWRVMHAGATPIHAVDVAAAKVDTPAMSSGSDAEINASPAHPLTASDFGQQPAPASALANVDPRSIALNPSRLVPVDGKPNPGVADSTLAQAAASTIRAQRPAAGVQPVAVKPVAVQPVIVQPAAPAQQPASITASATARSPVTAQAVAAATPAPVAAAPVSAPSAERTASGPEAPTARAALHRIRHLSVHHTNGGSGDTPAAQAEAPLSSTAKSSAPKGGDVQLF